MKVSKAEVLAHAQKLKRLNPEITSDELRASLRERFVESNHLDDLKVAGAAYNLMDWIRGLHSIFGGLIRLIDNNDPSGTEEIIEGVIIIVMD